MTLLAGKPIFSLSFLASPALTFILDSGFTASLGLYRLRLIGPNAGIRTCVWDGSECRWVLSVPGNGYCAVGV